jgi:hypothetical protein
MTKSKARNAYERAMLARGMRGAWPVALLVPLAMLVHAPASSPSLILAIGAALVLALVALGWRGGAWARGAWTGLVAGIPLFLVPVVIAPRDACAHACAHGPPMACVIACTAIGVAAGVGIAWLASRDPNRSARLVASILVAGLVGSLTCVVAGGAAVLGAAAGLTVGSIPVVALLRTR